MGVPFVVSSVEPHDRGRWGGPHVPFTPFDKLRMSGTVSAPTSSYPRTRASRGEEGMGGPFVVSLSNHVIGAAGEAHRGLSTEPPFART